MRARRLLAAAAVLAGAGAGALAALPAAASADTSDTCTITVTLDGSSLPDGLYANVPVPAGATSQADLLDALIAAGDVTPSQLDLSQVTLTDICVPAAPTTTTTTTTSGTTPTVTTTTTTTTTAGPTGATGPTGVTGPATVTSTPTTPPPVVSPAPTTSTTTSGSTTTTTTSRTTTTRSPSSTTSTGTRTTPGAAHREPGSTRTTTSTTSTTPAQPGHSRREKASSTPGPSTTTGTSRTGTSAGNSATAANPFSLGLPGTFTFTTVPNFFIQSFQIPPFLLPIYQAAGIEYQVPWQVLAAINEVETDFGRDLSISSAGAVGWMQFMPATWKKYGVDATGNGVADPFNPVDAIFAAARYLHAAGASQNLRRAIFAYNHADWYVNSVLLRAKLIASYPTQLISDLSDMVEGHFPVAAKATYADESAAKVIKAAGLGTNLADTVDSDNSRGAVIDAKPGSKVIAVNDGKIIKIGHSAALGDYITLQDDSGNVYTYAELGSVSREYAAPKPVAITHTDIKHEMADTSVRAPKTAASAGAQVRREAAATASVPTEATGATTATTSTGGGSATITSTTASSSATGTAGSGAGASPSATEPMVKERLFAYPTRPRSYAAGGRSQVPAAGHAAKLGSFDAYFTDDTLHLARDQYTLKHLRVGSIVVAGTVLGRIGRATGAARPHMYFTIQPGGRTSPDIDPKPILDGWKLLTATDIYRDNDASTFYGQNSKNLTTGQILLMSKQQLTERVLTDPHVKIYACGRRDIEAGTIDRRVLAVIEFLSASGLHPTVSGLACDASANGSTGVDAAGATGESVDISAINGTPIEGHQGPGSITDVTIRRLLTLQGSMAPVDIVSDMSYKDQSSTLALPDHANRIQISYTPYYGTDRADATRAAAASSATLKAGQWKQLISQIGKIPEPVVRVNPSKYAIRRSSR